MKDEPGPFHETCDHMSNTRAVNMARASAGTIRLAFGGTITACDSDWIERACVEGLQAIISVLGASLWVQAEGRR
jgi:hypothetical protein